MSSLTEWPTLASSPAQQPPSGLPPSRSGAPQQQQQSQHPQQQHQQQQSTPPGAPGPIGPAWLAQLSSTRPLKPQCGIWLRHSNLATFMKQVLEEDYLEVGEDPLPTLRHFFKAHRADILRDECTLDESGIPVNIPTTKTDLPDYALLFLRTHVAPPDDPYGSPRSDGGTAGGVRGRSSTRRDSPPTHGPNAAGTSPVRRRVQPPRASRSRPRNPYWEGISTQSKSPRRGSS